MADHYENTAPSLTSPASGGFTITPLADTDLETITRALYVGTGGTLAVVLQWGQTVTLVNVPDGALLPIRVRRVLPASTATDLVGFY
jgi:hypothetical protein